jgi:hypothetical protein
MVVRVVLEAFGVLAGTLAVILATLQVETRELPAAILWLAFIVLAVAVSVETITLIQAT